MNVTEAITDTLALTNDDARTGDHSEESWLTARRRTFRRRALVALGLFFMLQGVVAFLVTRNAKQKDAQRRARRPETYPSRRFDEIELERGEDQLKLYMEGHSLLRDMIDAIDRAAEYVYLETFILVDDTTGRAIRDALERAAARGVKVYAMYDWLLSSRLPDGWFSSNVNVIAFKPIEKNITALKPSNMIRDHRKLIVVDGAEAYVGGYNFGDEYLSWRDSHVRIRGGSVGDMENAFVDFWNQNRSLLTPKLPNVKGRSWDPHITVHRNDPSLAIFPIRGMYMEAIDRAERNIYITNAYFVPDGAFRASLIEAARRGVDVRIMLPAYSNHTLTDVLAHGMFEELLGAGIRVHLFKEFMVHAKTCTIDGTWSTVGTANLDRWSMLGNHEINLEVRSKAFAEHMEQMFQMDLDYCVEIELDVWTRRPQHWKISERTLRSLSPLM